MKKFFRLLWLICFVLQLKGSNGVYWPCKSSADCSAEGAECFPEVGQCKCKDFESVFSSDFKKCLKTSQFGDACKETSQCNLMPSGAICRSGVCDCADGQTYLQGRCKPLNGLGESCKTDTDCYFGYDRQSVSCKNYVCECANGYYQRYGNICRRKSMEIDDACVVNSDCSELGENARCVQFVCQMVNNTLTDSPSTIETPSKTKTTTTSTDSEITSDPFRSSVPLLNGRSDRTDAEIQTEEYPASIDVRGVAVQTSFESWDPKPLSPEFKDVATVTSSRGNTVRKEPVAAASHLLKRYQHLLRRFDDAGDKSNSTLSNMEEGGGGTADRKYGDACTKNAAPCNGLPHSICSNNICLCEAGYYGRGRSRCFAELGEIADSAVDCESSFDESSRRCLCRKNFFYESNLRSCRKPIAFNLACTSNSQCSPFGAAYCHSDVPRRCTCAQYAEYNELQQLCLFNPGHLGAECDNNESCAVPNSECSSNRACICKKYYIEKAEECIAGVGAGCAADNDCNVENSVCEAMPMSPHIAKPLAREPPQSTCQCRKGFVHFRDECLKEAEAIDDPCVESEQCKPLLATCIDSKCVCTKQQHYKNGLCEDKKGLGENCVRASQCYVPKEPDSVECRNSFCQCKFGYQADRGTCARVLVNKKNSSGRPSVLKVITFLLIGSAFLITSAAIKQAYF